MRRLAAVAALLCLAWLAWLHETRTPLRATSAPALEFDVPPGANPNRVLFVAGNSFSGILKMNLDGKILGTLGLSGVY